MSSSVRVPSNDVFSHAFAMLHLQVIVPHTRTVYCSIFKQILYFCLILSRVLNLVDVQNTEVRDK